MNTGDLIRVHVAVVGAGPAGARAARAAAEAGCSVLMVDHRAVPGQPVQCGEWIPLALAGQEPLPPGVVLGRLEGMRTVILEGDLQATPRVLDEGFLRAPGLMIDRGALDAALVRQAADAGVRVWTRASAVAPFPGGIVVRCRGRAWRVRAEVVVGADGPLSSVGRWIGSRNEHLVVARQYVLPLAGPAGDAAEVYFHPQLPGGYGWLFPRGKTANVGVGINPQLVDAGTLRQRLDAFVAWLARSGRVEPRPLRRSGGWIPVGGPLSVLGRGPYLLAGDAAGLAHPLTGAGVAAAIESGRWAGEMAAWAARAGREAAEEYARRIAATLLPPLQLAAAARAWRDAHWADPPGGFAHLVKEAWPGLAGYRARYMTMRRGGACYARADVG